MKFILEEQYQIYLKKAELDERKMGEIQKRETRLAFYAGISQTVLYYLGLVDMEEVEAVQEMEGIMQQVNDFWKSFSKKYDKN